MPVCTDMGAANMVAPIVQVLSKQEHGVFPVLERLGIDRWPEVCEVLPIPVTGEPAVMLGHYHPDVVVVGTSFPNHLEGSFARAAQEFGILLVVVEDFWGGFRRLGLLRAPNLVLTLECEVGVLPIC